MPICFERNLSNPELLACTKHLGELSEFQERDSRCLKVGLINNMPDAALEATERQFLKVLDSASSGFLVRLSFLALPEVPRNEMSRQRIGLFYSSESLWNSHFDGLIVTGREPRTPNLKDEPYWRSLTQALEWANDDTYSTVWSCLAAHAAVLHMDSIGRLRSEAKHFGIFACKQILSHQLMAAMPLRFNVPHSRWNGLAEDELSACGYTVLSRAEDAGVDTFVKQRKSLFVCFQGHPEYESETLVLEFRRDVRRFLMGEADRYPSMPRNYFDQGTTAALESLREKAVSGRNKELLADLDKVLVKRSIANTWVTTGTRVYSKWLEYIASRKDQQLRGATPVMKVRRAVPVGFATGLS
jgi:homoserine O-succinyltransferase